jgi:hypothetical protein
MKVGLILKPKAFENFTVVPNTVLRDQELSLAAVGLYCFMLSHSADFTISIEYLSNAFSNGKDAIRAKIKELETAGYLRRQKVQDPSGKFIGYNYIISETALAANSRHTEKPTTVKTDDGKNRRTENPTQSNNIYIDYIDTNNNKKRNTNALKISKQANDDFEVKKAPKEYAELTTKIYPYFLGLFEGENTVPKTTAQKEKWLDTIEYFKKHYDLKEIYYAVKWARSDDFWRPNVLSVPALKTTAKNGAKKIDNLLAKYKAHLEEQNKPNGMFKIPDATWRLDEHQNVIALRKLGPPINEFVLQQHFTLTPDEINEIRTYLINKQ